MLTILILEATSKFNNFPQNPFEISFVPFDESGLLVNDFERITKETKDIRK